MSTRLAEERDKAEADSREKETRCLALSRALQVNLLTECRQCKSICDVSATLVNHLHLCFCA